MWQLKIYKLELEKGKKIPKCRKKYRFQFSKKKKFIFN